MANRGKRPLSVLAWTQVSYQLRLLARTPLAAFTVLAMPLMLLVALNLVTPEMTLDALRGLRVADFLTPAMATFAMLNACYVNVVTSVVLAREGGVLKRLHGTPLPLWAYLVGRISAALLMCVLSVAAVLAVAALFFDVQLSASRVGGLAASLSLGALCFSLIGLAVSAMVTRADTSLPLAYGTILPLAFISDVFFPSTSAPVWLRHFAEAFPLSPVVKPAETVFATRSGWTMTGPQLGVLLGWTAAALLVAVVFFHWEPGRPHPLQTLRGWRWRWIRPGARHVGFVGADPLGRDQPPTRRLKEPTGIDDRHADPVAEVERDTTK
jgi:ABC-2 type transport system permease protein